MYMQYNVLDNVHICSIMYIAGGNFGCLPAECTRASINGTSWGTLMTQQYCPKHTCTHVYP